LKNLVQKNIYYLNLLFKIKSTILVQPFKSQTGFMAKIKQYITLLLVVFTAYTFISSSGGVPQAVTLAPGESGKNCSACHSGGNFDAKVDLTVKDAGGNIVTSYTPDQTYALEVKVSGNTNAKTYGFQMVALTDTGNKDMGIWSNLGQRVKSINLLQRKYMVQSSPKADGIFTMNWKAPAVNEGNISFYFSGLAANLNGGTAGDQPVSNKKTLSPVGTSSVDNTGIVDFMIYPNPATDRLYVKTSSTITSWSVYPINGQTSVITVTDVTQGISIDQLAPGTYLLEGISTLPFITKRTLFVKM